MTRKTTKQCFVISPIGKKNSKTNKQANHIFTKIIAPSAKKCNYEPKRADHLNYPGVITSQIIQHLIEDPLVIADLTNHNPNVLYELAIRHILKKPVVQIIKKGQKIPFDVAAIKTIFYDVSTSKTISQTKTELTKQILSAQKDPTQVDAPFTSNVFSNTTLYTNKKEINEYMLNLILSGSSLDIVSHNLSWVKDKIKSSLISRANDEIEINIYLPKHNSISKELKRNNIKIHICKDLGKSPHARFTLVDKSKPGSSKLAVGVGNTPRFVISEFTEQSNAQVVAMARDYVDALRRSK